MKIYWPANTVPNGVESISVIDWPINTFPKCIRVLCGRLNNNNILRIKNYFPSTNIAMIVPALSPLLGLGDLQRPHHPHVLGQTKTTSDA